MSEKKIVVLGTGGTIAGTATAAHDNIGYTAAQASDAVRRVSEEAGDAAAEDLVKRALAVLARPSMVTR